MEASTFPADVTMTYTHCPDCKDGLLVANGEGKWARNPEDPTDEGHMEFPSICNRCEAKHITNVRQPIMRYQVRGEFVRK